jgi:hypothetical protein
MYKHLFPAGKSSIEAEAIVKGEGFALHRKQSECPHGCIKCQLARAAIKLPLGIALLHCPSSLPKRELKLFMERYNIPFKDDDINQDATGRHLCPEHPAQTKYADICAVRLQMVEVNMARQ